MSSDALKALLGAKTDVTADVFIRRLGVNFTVKALTAADLDRVKQECTFGDGRGGKRLDETMHDAAMLARACVTPSFADKELIAHYGAEDAADCVKKALLPGEAQKLVGAVLKLSGYGPDEDADIPN